MIWLKNTISGYLLSEMPYPGQRKRQNGAEPGREAATKKAFAFVSDAISRFTQKINAPVKVEHITLGGNSVIRETDDILPTTKRYFSKVKIAYQSGVFHLSEANTTVKITATPEGAAFDMMLGGDIIVTNFCCFSASQSDAVMELVSKVADILPFGGPKKPAMSIFLYSAIINPFAPPEWVRQAGEIELYVFERLYSAWVEAQN